jgi:hypothetical protein
MAAKMVEMVSLWCFVDVVGGGGGDKALTVLVSAMLGLMNLTATYIVASLK